MGKHFAYAKFLTPDMITDIFNIICCHQNLLGTDSILSHSPLFPVSCPLPLCFILSPPASQRLWVFSSQGPSGQNSGNWVSTASSPVLPAHLSSINHLHLRSAAENPRFLTPCSSGRQITECGKPQTWIQPNFLTSLRDLIPTCSLLSSTGVSALLPCSEAWVIIFHLGLFAPACLPASPSHHS